MNLFPLRRTVTLRVGLLVLALLFLTSCSAGFQVAKFNSVTPEQLVEVLKSRDAAIMQLDARLKKLEPQAPKENNK